jgi:hypothetical protein
MSKKYKFRVAMTDTFEGEQFTFAITYNVANKSTAFFMAASQFPECPVVEVRRLSEVTV